MRYAYEIEYELKSKGYDWIKTKAKSGVSLHDFARQLNCSKQVLQKALQEMGIVWKDLK